MYPHIRPLTIKFEQHKDEELAGQNGSGEPRTRIRRTWQMRPPIYKVTSRSALLPPVGDEEIHSNIEAERIRQERRAKNKIVHQSGSCVMGQHNLNQFDGDGSVLRLPKFPKRIVRETRFTPHEFAEKLPQRHPTPQLQLDRPKSRGVKHCEDCSKRITNIEDRSLCDMCMVKVIMANKKGLLRDYLVSISEEIDLLLGGRKSNTTYMSAETDRMALLWHKLKGFAKTYPDEEVSASTKAADGMRQIVKDSVKRNRRKEVLSTKTQKLLEYLKEDRPITENNSFLSTLRRADSLSTSTATAGDHMSLEDCVKVLKLMDKKTRSAYRTTNEAKKEICDVKMLFSSHTNPAIRIRPTDFWCTLEERNNNILENLKPVVRSLQVNRLESPFDCFLGEEWLKEYSRHTSLERERVKESLVPGKKEYNHSRKSKRRLRFDKVQSKEKLKVGEIWEKFGVRAHMKAIQHRINNMEITRFNRPSLTTALSQAEALQLVAAHRKGRRPAITDDETEAIHQTRMNHTSKSRSLNRGMTVRSTSSLRSKTRSRLQHDASRRYGATTSEHTSPTVTSDVISGSDDSNPRKTRDIEESMSERPKSDNSTRKSTTTKHSTSKSSGRVAKRNILKHTKTT